MRYLPAAILLSACIIEAPAEDHATLCGSCTVDADCGAGNICYGGTCHAPGVSVPPTTSCTMPAQPTAGAWTETTVQWGADPSQVVLVLAPAAGVTQPQPIVEVHGGAWNSGGPSNSDAYAAGKAWTTTGRVVFSLGYRLASPGGTAHALEETSDVRCGIRYAMAHAVDFGAVGSRLAVVGHSAGAHLGLLSLLGPANDDGTCPLTGPVSAAGFVGVSGPYDLNVSGGTVAANATSLLGYAPSSNPSGAASWSPLSYPHPSMPLVLIHETGDPQVPYVSSTSMDAAARAHGENVTFVGTNLTGAHNLYLFIPNLPARGCSALTLVQSL